MRFVILGNYSIKWANLLGSKPIITTHKSTLSRYRDVVGGSEAGAHPVRFLSSLSLG